MPKEEGSIRARNTKVNKDHNLKAAASFSDRLRVQKAVFFLKRLGIEPFIKYDFSLYLHGPYSPMLAHEYYNMGAVVTEPPGLSNDIVAKLDWFMEHDDKWLEIATSIIDIKDNNKRVSTTNIFETIQMSKPWVSKEYFNSILKELRKNSL